MCAGWRVISLTKEKKTLAFLNSFLMSTLLQHSSLVLLAPKLCNSDSRHGQGKGTRACPRCPAGGTQDPWGKH